MQRKRLRQRNYCARFMRHMRRICENSAIAGIMQIVKARNAAQRLLRTLVFFSCAFGLGYQFWAFLHLYWDYPVVMDVEVDSPSEIVIPAFTICDYKGYTLRDYCSMTRYPCQPVDNETKFCEMNERYCRYLKLPENFRVPPNETVVIHEIMNDLDFEPEINNLEEHIIKKCEILTAGSSPSIPCRRARRAPYTKGEIEIRTNCFMFNSIWAMPKAQSENIPSTAVINLLLLTNDTDYFPFIPDQYISMYIDFHAPTTLANPFLNGFVMYPGLKYKYYIKERILNLLPAPYSTNCTNYETQWKENGNKGPVSQADCIETCKLKLILKQRKCVDFFNWYPHNERICETGCKDIVCSNGYKDIDDMSTSLIKFAKQCSQQCRPACYQKIYDVTKEEIQVPEEVFKNVPNRRTWKKYIYIQLSFDKFETTTYTYSPKFEFIETFFYFGGYVGIWLGISLVAVFDFFESIIKVMKHPYKRIKKKLQRKILPAVLQQEQFHDY